MRRFAASLALVAAAACPPSASAAAPSHAGRFITDAAGRVVVLHGVNMVYKRPPYYPQAAGFSSDDAAFLARNGLNIVRVGVIWKAVEPRSGVYDDAYLSHIAATVRILAQHGIYSLLDFHQDMYNERFQGEGAPDWAVKDDGLPALPQFGFPDNYELMPALQVAFDNFWSNADGLENHYAAAWAHVASRFRGVHGVLGYELFNEPFPGTPYLTCALPVGCPAFDGKLTAFNRLVSHAIRAVDRRTLIFYEPNVLFDFGFTTDVGALDHPEAGFAFHDYCFTFSPTGCPSETTGFQHALAHVKSTREALLLTEFGSTTAVADLSGMVSAADRDMVSWTEWAYCPCNDPTGSTPDPFVVDPAKPPTGSNVGQLALHILVEPYPQLIAGTPLSWGFDRSADRFTLQYSTARADGHGRFREGAISEVFIPRRLYTHGYTAHLKGGSVMSRPGAQMLLIAQRRGAKVINVTVSLR
jgi:endoglycosylceramidase